MVIYKFSLSENIDMSTEIRDKIKLLAYLVYSELIDYEYEADRKVLFKDSIIFNELYDGINNKYEFEYEDYKSGIYEPFMIGDDVFGFTIYDGSITMEELLMIVNEIKKIIQIEFVFDIEMIEVINSENRINTIKSFYLNDKSKERTKS